MTPNEGLWMASWRRGRPESGRLARSLRRWCRPAPDGTLPERDQQIERRISGRQRQHDPAVAPQRGLGGPQERAAERIARTRERDPDAERDFIGQSRERCEEQRDLRAVDGREAILVVRHQAVHSRGLRREVVELRRGMIVGDLAEHVEVGEIVSLDVTRSIDPAGRADVDRIGGQTTIASRKRQQRQVDPDQTKSRPRPARACVKSIACWLTRW
jgi:hypothetical protein